MNTTFKTWIKIPRWARAQHFLRETAYEFQLPIQLNVERGWFTEKITFTVNGPRENVDRFKRKVHRAILHYNSD